MTEQPTNPTRIALTPEESALLVERFRLPAELAVTIQSHPADGATIHIDEDLADDLREQAADLLQVEGFDEDYIPTPTGRILESLIDKFYLG